MSRADDLYADHDPNAAGAALNERDAALATVARVQAWRDQLADQSRNSDSDLYDSAVAEYLTELLTPPAAPKEPTP
jgi:hypothetical protein